MKWIAELIVEPRDLWIGLYWDRKRVDSWTKATHLHFCLIPMIVLHVFQVPHAAFVAAQERKKGGGQ